MKEGEGKKEREGGRNSFKSTPLFEVHAANANFFSSIS